MMYRPFAGVCGALLLLALPVPAQRAMPAADASRSDTLRLSLEDAVESGLRVADEIRLAHAPQVHCTRTGGTPGCPLTFSRVSLTRRHS